MSALVTDIHKVIHRFCWWSQEKLEAHLAGINFIAILPIIFSQMITPWNTFYTKYFVLSCSVDVVCTHCYMIYDICHVMFSSLFLFWNAMQNIFMGCVDVMGSWSNAFASLQWRQTGVTSCHIAFGILKIHPREQDNSPYISASIACWMNIR